MHTNPINSGSATSTGFELPKTKSALRTWVSTDGPGVWTASPDQELLEQVRQIALVGWRDRARERGFPEPSDLSSSCMFSSLLVRALFGGTIRGNHDHQFNQVGGVVIDLNSTAADVAAIRARGCDPYWHDRRFFGNADHLANMLSCMPRVANWLDICTQQIDPDNGRAIRPSRRRSAP